DTGHRARGDVAALAAALRVGDAARLGDLLGDPVEPDEAFASPRAVARIAPSAEAGATLTPLMRAYARDVFGAAYAEALERFRQLPVEEESLAISALWRRASRARVLAPLRQGPVSADRANRVLRELLEPAWRRAGDARGIGFHG